MSHKNLSSSLSKHWILDEKILFLNHGSFGACPKAVLQKQDEYRERFEKEPVAFVVRELDELIIHSRNVLARFIGCKPSNMVLVQNVTHGVSTVLRSLPFRRGDEVIITNHIYGACRIALNFIAKKTGIRIHEVEIDFPIESQKIITSKILEAVTPKTKLVFIDHITSPTAIIFPVKEIVKELDKLGVDCFIDGAHAPGSIPLNINDINPAYYTGNCHKWMCAPKGVGFLYVRDDMQSLVNPLALSHFSAGDRHFTDRFHWAGTIDPSAALCIPDAVYFMEGLVPGGWPALMEQNHQLAIYARKLICGTIGIPLPCPDKMIASMAAIPVGFSKGVINIGFNEVDELQENLFQKHHIEVPVFTWPDKKKRIIRPSFQVYNAIEQYKFLAEKLNKGFFARGEQP